MATQIQLRRGTTAEWLAVDPILAVGEPAIDLTTGLLKIGNGIDNWSTLSGIDVYIPATPSDWNDPAPTTVQEAIDRLAAAVKSVYPTGA